MNKLINELSLKAEGYADDTDLPWLATYTEKFAELIIQDCVDILAGYRGKVIWLNEDTGHNHPIYEIQKHFGIK